MKIEKLQTNLYKLTADEGMVLKRISTEEVFEKEIYFGKEEMKNDYIEIAEEELEK